MLALFTRLKIAESPPVMLPVARGAPPRTPLIFLDGRKDFTTKTFVAKKRPQQF
jgi:hypothetical protein